MKWSGEMSIVLNFLPQLMLISRKDIRNHMKSPHHQILFMIQINQDYSVYAAS